MKIVLTGANGMLGRDVMARLAPHHVVRPYPREALDVTRPERVDAVIAEAAPDAVVNCAAFTDVDACETERDTAMRVNALGPRHLARAAGRAGAALLHVSTDYVFDGTGDTPYTEFDPTGPATFYGRSKLAGEVEARRHCPRHFIVRTAWLYGTHGRNFVHTMLKLAAERDRLTVVDDQRGNPTWTRDVAEVIARLIETDAYGTYHATSEGICSWYDFARAILAERGVGTPLEPVSSAAYPRPATRPAFSALRNLCLESLGITMRPWRAALTDFLTEGAP